MHHKTKNVHIGICLFLLLAGIALVVLFRETILARAGRFMAPQGNYVADAAILEGTEFIDRHVVAQGMDLLSSGRVKRLYVVLFNIAPSGRPFAINQDYPAMVEREMTAQGLKKRAFKVIVTHIHQPLTLTSAKGVVGILAQDRIRTAILLSPGFHARRSYLVYQHVCNPYQIRIFPAACFYTYSRDHWWTEEAGLRDFSMESMKLVYYLAARHIPLKLSYEGY